MVKRMVVLCCVLLCGTVWGQESDLTRVTTTTTGGEDLLTQLWFMEDATPLDAGQVDLRLGFRWVTESGHASMGDTSDDFVLTLAIVWGAHEDLELSLSVDNWLGDGGDMGPFEDGNYDTTIGILWRLHEQGNKCAEPGCIRLPSIALSAGLRLPTGCSSSGMDGELRLIMTNEYDSGVRSHFNAFVKGMSDDNLDDHDWGNSDSDWGLWDVDDVPFVGWFWGDGDDDDPELRDFQWGLVIGADGPLCSDGAVRWVADYMHRSSKFNGRGDMDILELGWEWTLSEAHKLGMSMHGGLDHTDDNPNFGAGFVYAWSIGM